MTTIQDIFNRFYPRYTQEYTPYAQQAKAANAIMRCRTEAMGGNVYDCEECGHTVVHYNSCRNRHCPSCQGVSNAVWVDARNKDILDAPYFHLVFTMPEQLHQLILQNQELLYSLMYRTVAETISEISSDKKHLGAQVGFFSVIHTWGQDLHFHPHIHTVVLAGGLNKLNQWQESSKKFFIPVKVLSEVMRGKFLDRLKKYYLQNKLKFYESALKYMDSKVFLQLISQCYQKCWYSYAKETFKGPLAVMKYLGRYTHRIAISNSRIVSMDDNLVTINVKDYKDSNKSKTVTMTGVEFVRRFLMHVLPKGFVKARHFGLFANINKKTKLALCKKLTLSPIYKAKYEGLKTIEILCLMAGKDIRLCPCCRECRLELARTLASKDSS